MQSTDDSTRPATARSWPSHEHTAPAAAQAPDGSPLAIAQATQALIAQAKQQLMDSHGMDASEAFELLRQYSRASDLPIRDVALQLVRHEWVPSPPSA